MGIRGGDERLVILLGYLLRFFIRIKEAPAVMPAMLNAVSQALTGNKVVQVDRRRLSKAKRMGVGCLKRKGY